jgi:hypothetical protein
MSRPAMQAWDHPRFEVNDLLRKNCKAGTTSQLGVGLHADVGDVPLLVLLDVQSLDKPRRHSTPTVEGLLETVVVDEAVRASRRSWV